MADLFDINANLYVDVRPTYPPELLEFITSKTSGSDLVWDVGTGSGQAAFALAKIFKNVVGTDTSQQQLSFAPKIPNVRFQQTPANMTMAELESHVASQGTVDLVTIAQAYHWFDHQSFNQQVKWVLKNPNGVFAAWGYSEPKVNDAVDAVCTRMEKEITGPYWAQPPRTYVDNKYMNIDFPFEPVEGEERTGPFEFEAIKSMDLESYLSYIRTWSGYQTALGQGVELLTDDVVKDFEKAWGGDKTIKKTVRYPIFMRLGRVGAE
ncbi:hypothetical protein NE237_010555 [Protea cynaroides]|uniref:Methyltransferase type 11 domain-containing protein n=1 Tax=Protea cynaroides TaxID=273540 RepID=A0A9Q0L008_9MAGN|nr:hypothetical protein NE237_010555 [Protea cynaroides]